MSFLILSCNMCVNLCGMPCSSKISVCSFVCVEVLQPSQPNEVMSSAVILPNHTFTGQA